jgi:hypothetical protein
MFAKEPSGYSLVRTTVDDMLANRQRLIKSNISEVIHTNRSGGLDGINLRVHTPSGTTIINHSFESQSVVTQVDYLSCSRRLLTPNICTILSDIPSRGLCSRGKAGHLIRSGSQCPDICIDGITRSKVSILGSKLVELIISECLLLKCGVFPTGVVSMLETKAGLPSVKPEPLTSLTDCQRCEP